MTRITLYVGGGILKVADETHSCAGFITTTMALSMLCCRAPSLGW